MKYVIILQTIDPRLAQRFRLLFWIVVKLIQFEVLLQVYLIKSL